MPEDQPRCRVRFQSATWVRITAAVTTEDAATFAQLKAAVKRVCAMRVFGPIVPAEPPFVGQLSRSCRNAETYGRSLSVTSNFGANPCFLRSSRISTAQRVAIAPVLYQHDEDLA
jgi:hypothetical protein